MRCPVRNDQTAPERSAGLRPCNDLAVRHVHPATGRATTNGEAAGSLGGFDAPVNGNRVASGLDGLRLISDQSSRWLAKRIPAMLK